MNSLKINVMFVPAGTGSAVWDNPHAGEMIQRFMPAGRGQSPVLGIVHLGGLRPTPSVLRDVVIAVGEDARAGRYGEFTFVVSSDDDATRTVITDIANAQGVAMFVTSSSISFKNAEPVGGITARERETLDLVLNAGGTVTATEFAQKMSIEQTTAGNRLVALHKKGYLQRVERPHPGGDLFVDPRSIRFDETVRD